MKTILTALLALTTVFAFGQVPLDSLSLWLRSDSGVVLNGSDVLQWNDISGNNRHASTISATAPQFIPNEICGQPVVRFNGSSTYMVTPAFQTFAGMRGTIFVVVRVNGSGNGAGGYGTFVSIFMPGEWQFGSYSTSSYAFYDGAGGSNMPFATSPPNQWGILALNRKYDDTISFYKSGILAANDDIAMIQPAPNTIKIGSRGDSYEVLNGDIAEIIVYNKSLSETEMYQVNVYLANKYCFNSNVPVPTATDQAQCGPGQFTLTASGGTHYRWYDSPMSTILLDTNAVFITTVLSATDTFWVANYNDTLESQRVPVIATVHPLPVATLSLSPDTLCLSDSPLPLTTGFPLGGTYSGPAVSSGYFDPSLAGTGYSDVVYLYTDTNGCSASDTSSMYVDICTGTEQFNSPAVLSIIPQPSTGVFTIPNFYSTGTIEIYSSVGELVYSEIKSGTGSITLDVDLPAGVYTIVMKAEKSVSRGQIIIVD